ncbi:MAG: 3-hydroxyacyl-ACP dehydratase FabZ [Verrucomicrobia bacterium]|nr:3-hydroxyacyl-ACP dehydratase FabZ [Verrucomicrobiota bacterium]
METVIGPEEILKTLPHRYPFLYVDRIIECDYEKRIVGVKNLTFNEPFFQGHFPGDPIMPGVLQLEAMAQVGGILLNKTHGGDGEIAYFLAVDKARFRRLCRPGDQLKIEIDVLRIRLNMCKVHGVVSVDGEISCEADLMFGGNQ